MPRLGRPLLCLFSAMLMLGLTPAAYASGGHGAKSGKPKPAAHGAAAAHGKQPAVEPLDPKVVEIPVLVAPITKRGKLKQYLYVSVKLAAKSETQAAKIKKNLPMIQDAFIRNLHEQPIEMMEADTPDAAAKLAERLRSASVGLINQSALERVEVGRIVRVPL